MSIFPLEQFEADLKTAMDDQATYERLKPPTSIVVRFGLMRLVGEFPYTGDQKPGCGSKMVVRTFRGTEIGEMLTSTCPNAGCSKSVTRQEMLEYIENSGGKDYPFFTDGRVLRVATAEDMTEQSRLDAQKMPMVRRAREIALANGVRFAYTGNVHEGDGGSTHCPLCGTVGVERDWYELGHYGLDDSGHCTACGTRVPGVFDGPAGTSMQNHDGFEPVSGSIRPD